MTNKDQFENLPTELFVFDKEVHDAEGLTTKPISFWRDAVRRLMKNPFAVVSLIVILSLVLISNIAPFFAENKIYEPVESNLYVYAQLPPRVPVLEKIGIFDGTLTKEILASTFDESKYSEGEYKIKEVIEKNDLEYYVVKEYTYKINDIEDEYYYFGTDILARNIWDRVWFGVRISLLIGFYAAFIDMLIGVVYGGIAGYFGGTTLDSVMMRILEVIYGIPSIVILLALFMFITPGIIPIAIAIALTSWISVARMVRAQFLRLREQEFVLAAKTLGASTPRIIMVHLVPNVLAQIIVMMSFSIPGAIFYEAFLAFIGIGLNLDNPSLGVLINDALSTSYGAMTYVYQLVIPSVILSILMLSINLLANGLRDALDPRMRNS